MTMLRAPRLKALHREPLYRRPLARRPLPLTVDRVPLSRSEYLIILPQAFTPHLKPLRRIAGPQNAPQTSPARESLLSPALWLLSRVTWEHRRSWDKTRWGARQDED